jgi:hypothetical protein
MHDGTLGWTGERYVSLRSEAAPQALDNAPFAPLLPEDPNAWRSHEVVTYDAVYGDARPLRTALPSNACGPSITEMAGRVLLTWFRRTRNGCDQGEASYQVLGRRGEALTPARVLLDGSGSLPVSAISARWDFGRAVIVASRTNSGLDPAWVLSASGDVLWHGFAGGVVCSRAGCVRVRVDRESSVGEGFGGNSLRFERLDDEAQFSVSAQARDVRGVVASGDRVLVLHTPQGSSGCDFTVVDVATRAVVGEHHEDSVSCDERRVRATPRGYLFAGVDRSPGAVWRTIDCTR